MRLYTFGNYYLSSIQQGIQAAHVVAEFFVDYSYTKTVQQKLEQVLAWAIDYKTIICLNGGNNKGLEEIRRLFDMEENPYAWTMFAEDEQSLNNTMTCLGIILPQKFYDCENYTIENYTEYDNLILKLIQDCKLAK